jgi:hypothetical protein
VILGHSCDFQTMFVTLLGIHLKCVVCAHFCRDFTKLVLLNLEKIPDKIISSL